MTGLNEGLSLKMTQAVTIAIALIIVTAMFWFLNHTRTGKSMRAYSDNEDLALLSGIDPDRVVMVHLDSRCSPRNRRGHALQLGQIIQTLCLHAAIASDIRVSNCRRLVIP